MIVDLFNELQMPQPWAVDHERAVFTNALAQVRLADELGYGCWWSVEHHCTPEFSYSGAPELMNAAIAQRTERIRVGHAGVLTPFKINHPLRVAERAAVLDHLSNGRVELGLARSGGAEWATFGIDPDATLAELEEAARLCVTAWTEPEFTWESERLSIPTRTVVPEAGAATAPARCGRRSRRRAASAWRASSGWAFSARRCSRPCRCSRRWSSSTKPASPHARTRSASSSTTSAACSRSCSAPRRVDDAIKSRAAEAALWYVNAAPKVFCGPAHGLDELDPRQREHGRGQALAGRGLREPGTGRSRSRGRESDRAA